MFPKRTSSIPRYLQPVQRETMKDVFAFDIRNKITKLNLDIRPTKVNQQQVDWLYARNNKYSSESRDPNKTGKWMLFCHPKQINRIWNKVKQGIQNGNLWHAKVSTSDPTLTSHAIMIYTKDYTDLEDVVRVLKYLEDSGLKPRDKVIKYKTDNQTRAGIYSGGKERSWVYSSDTVREVKCLEDQTPNFVRYYMALKM